MKEEFENLDAPEAYAVDPHGYYDWTVDFGRQLSEAVKGLVPMARELSVPGEVRDIAVSGMGGSGISGDVAYAILRSVLNIPFHVCRDYELPSGIGKGTLAIIVSYSGNTEEAINAFESAKDRGADIVVVSSGGELEEIAGERDYPVMKIREDIPAPRLALPTLATAVAAIVNRTLPEPVDLKQILDGAVNTLADGVGKFEKERQYGENPAKRLAYELHGVFPVIVGSESTWPSVLRFQAQLNENAKWPAHVAKIPEMNHNEIVALGQPGPVTGRCGVLFLKDMEEDTRIARRMDFTAGIIEKHVAFVRTFEGEGSDFAARLFSLIQLADFTSYYLSIGRGLDPMDIRAITDLKKKMENG